MARRVTSRVLKSVAVLGFVCLNLAIASPADARLKTVSCIDPETGDTIECCESCWFINCNCEVQPDG